MPTRLVFGEEVDVALRVCLRHVIIEFIVLAVLAALALCGAVEEGGAACGALRREATLREGSLRRGGCFLILAHFLARIKVVNL